MRGAQSRGELGQVTWPGGSWSCDHEGLSHHPLLLSSLATLALELLGTAAVPEHLRASPQVSRVAVTPALGFSGLMLDPRPKSVSSGFGIPCFSI